MLITYYEDDSSGPRQASWPIAILMGVNVLMTGSILFAWTFLSLFVEEPLSWATWMPVHRGYGLLGIFEYPFMMLWLMPVIGVCGAWVGLKGGRKVMAYSFAAIPPVMMALVVGWFYLAPIEWH